MNDDINNSNIYQNTIKDYKILCKFYNNTISSSFSQTKPLNQVNCESIVSPVVSMQEGHKCVTYFSDLYGEVTRKRQKDPQQVQMNFDFEPVIMLLIKGEFLNSNTIKTDISGKEENKNSKNENKEHKKSKDKNGDDENIYGDGKGFWTNINDQNGNAYTGLYIAVHDPTAMPDMFYTRFHRLDRDQDLSIQFVKQIIKQLPPPYKTNCFHYKNKILESPALVDSDTLTGVKQILTRSGLSLYRSRGECYIYCMWRMLNTRRCVNFFSAYTKELVMNEIMQQMIAIDRLTARLHPVNYSQTRIEEIIANIVNNYDETIKFADKVFCVRSSQGYYEYIQSKKNCLEQCVEGCLMETYNEDQILITPNNNRNLVRINIEWSFKPVVTMEHNPKMSSSELLGTLGGHAHIWLGVSIIYLVYYLIRFTSSLSSLSSSLLLNFFSLNIIQIFLDKRKKNLQKNQQPQQQHYHHQ